MAKRILTKEKIDRPMISKLTAQGNEQDKQFKPKIYARKKERTDKA